MVIHHIPRYWSRFEHCSKSLVLPLGSHINFNSGGVMKRELTRGEIYSHCFLCDNRGGVIKGGIRTREHCICCFMKTAIFSKILNMRKSVNKIAATSNMLYIISAMFIQIFISNIIITYLHNTPGLIHCLWRKLPDIKLRIHVYHFWCDITVLFSTIVHILIFYCSFRI